MLNIFIISEASKGFCRYHLPKQGISIKRFVKLKIKKINMIIPVRCMSCGRPISGMWSKYKERVAAGQPPAKVLDELDIKSYCCRALFMTHQDVLGKVARFRV